MDSPPIPHAPSALTAHPRTRAAGRGLVLLLVLLATACCDASDPPVGRAAQPAAPAMAPPVNSRAASAEAPLPGAGPRAVIDWPVEHEHVGRQILAVRGRAAEVAQLYLNSEQVACKPDGSFAVRLEVSGGQGEIVVRDGARPDAPLLVRHVVVDLAAPMLELTELPGAAVDRQLYRRRVEGARAAFAGRAWDEAPGELGALTLDGAPLHVDADGTFRGELDVPAEGEKRFQLEATDRGGNRARIALTLVRG